MVRRMLTTSLVVAVLATTATAAVAQPRPGFRGPVFRVEPEARSEHVGWAYGNVTAGGRAYFMIPIPVQSPPDRRVTVDSWVIQSYATESP